MVKGFRRDFGAGMKIRVVTMAAAALVAASACTVKDTTAPPLSGPSEAALSLLVTASPDSISQDGASQSSIQVFARDANAKPISGLALRMAMSVGGLAQDFGTLSARSIVTGTDGKATAVYTAPPAPPAGANTSTCAGTIFSPSVPGTCVDITATPTSTAFQTVTAASVTLRLVPTGVILPPASTPTAAFTVSPTPVNAGTAVLFDASGSCPGQMLNGACSGGGSIASYAWTFGDGTSGDGRLVTHMFTGGGSFVVTLTVINDRGIAASVSQQVDVAAAAGPTANIIISPTAPTPGSTVFFNGGTSVAGPGRTIVAFTWDFGDGSPRATGAATSHVYNPPNPAVGATYIVVLEVRDDLGQTATATANLSVK